MAALDSGALLIEYGNLFVGADAATAVSVGAVRNVRFTGQQIHTKIDSDNRGTIIDKVRINGVVEADLLEVGNATILETIFKGIITKTTTAGSIVNNYVQVVASGAWLYNKIIFFDFNDADGTAPNIDSVVLGTNGAIVLNTDYMLVKDPATNKWGIIIIDSTTVTTESQSVTIQFDYTPAASMTLTGGTNQTATSRYVKIEGPSEDDSSVKRTVILSDCVAMSDMLVPFVEVEQANDVGVMPVRFENRKGATWTFEDAINPS